MKIYNSADLGLKKDSDITRELIDFFSSIKDIKEDKKLIIQEGTYYIDSDNADLHELFITNTCHEKEWTKPSMVNKYKSAIYMENIENLEIFADNVTLMLNGKLNNIVIKNCKNIKIKGLVIDNISPDLHMIEVVEKKGFSITYKVDNASKIVEKNNKLYFEGKDYFSDVERDKYSAHYIGKIEHNDKNNIRRVAHPFLASRKIQKVSDREIKVSYIFPKNYQIGDKFFLYEVHRVNNGIVITDSENITIEKVTQHFNYGLAFVAQMSKNILVDGVNFEPKNDDMLMASLADFMQVCMCSEDIIIKNSRFVGAGDDALNVHGIHLKVVEKYDNKLKLAFSHKQTYGFNIYEIGDIVAFINPKSLEEYGRAKVLNSRLLDTHTIELTLDNVDKISEGMVLENITKCPRLTYENNFLSRIITRGLLISTRGKSIVKNNYFDNTTMHAILCSNDAKSWYESGRVEDLTIENNTFNVCKMHLLDILPENAGYKNKVHKNISFINNKVLQEKASIRVKNCENFVEKNNKTEKPIKLIKK